MKLGPQRNYHKGRAAIRHYANQPADGRGSLRLLLPWVAGVWVRVGRGEVVAHGVLGVAWGRPHLAAGAVLVAGAAAAAAGAGLPPVLRTVLAVGRVLAVLGVVVGPHAACCCRALTNQPLITFHFPALGRGLCSGCSADRQLCTWDTGGWRLQVEAAPGPRLDSAPAHCSSLLHLAAPDTAGTWLRSALRSDHYWPGHQSPAPPRRPHHG